ncbi:hypothetical protein TVAG_509760 [Trichomonas vaginalis G3]|uniref:Uncharacterized protein n=1 Tax=Trichomonas vaginalis (strain ATCC PRA-98 / G3) TaxID=412133 RepID=A2G9D8_TRIV3|nr:hypothetical protein TVAGG3_0786620 [Trichomonas vaginalis G3]EAX86227.1 hypothetical protein TVAG_509760 [Trichomonas vaginalis G3]KAI5495437.1 hypothetical protein TVAGG3_0786620 [Trichomonas vaginalis G3]|eukprot:XP_001299157.1 hypothetical protein [Trichomonas vaginalis G3]
MTNQVFDYLGVSDPVGWLIIILILVHIIIGVGIFIYVGNQDAKFRNRRKYQKLE